MREGKGESLPELVEVMQRLLGEGGCPWDREQTLETLRPYVVEEAFEVVDAIDRGSPELLCEELGDLLMQVVFCAELARAEGRFGPDDVIAGIRDKLVRRHPHVFGDAKVSGAGEVLRNGRPDVAERRHPADGAPSLRDGVGPEGAEHGRARTREGGPIGIHSRWGEGLEKRLQTDWERIKAEEKKGRGTLEGVPVAMPALLRAVRVGEKAARVGYDWPDAAGVRAKIDEELAELDACESDEDRERELGDLLFAVASWARKRALDPEAALRRALDRFGARFAIVEARAKAEGVALESLDEAELDRRWRAAKAELDDQSR